MKNKILPILLLFLAVQAWAQPCKFYPAKNNLSSSRINGIFCDRWGNLWIPTEFGLNRYDGCDFVVFTNDPSDPASLASNYVSSVSEDSAGHLFVCSHGGIQLFDEGSRSFSTTAKDTDGTPYNKQVLCIIERANGDLLAIGTEVVKLEIRDGSLRVMDTDFTLPAGYVRDICEDSWGSLWFKIDGHGVVRLKPDGSIKEFFSSPEHHVTDIFENPAGHELLVADTNEGLFVFDQIADVFNHVPYGGGLLPASLLYSYGNRLLVGTEGKGLKSWDGDEITSFSLKGENSFEDGRVRGFTTDQGGNLWLAFYQEGLVLVPSKSGNFNYIGHNSTEEDKIGSGSISAICRTRDGIMWIATMSGELYGFDGGGRKVASFKSDGSPTSIPNPVFSLFEDSRGNVWTGSFSSGVSILNTRSGRCSRILPGGGQVLSGNVVDFTEDESGCIWIATEGSGLLRYDPGRGELRNMSEELPDFPRHITSIKAARHGRLMVGTYRGSFYLDLNDSFRIVRISSDDIAHDVIEASDERIWFGCDDGVTVWNPNTGRIIKYGEAEGLSGDVVYSILEDRGGGIWMGTNNGLSYYNISRNRFFNYMEEDGVQGKEFCSGATWEDADGTLWFGGVDGVTWFDPRKISSPVRKWNLKITDVYMHGQPIKTTTISGNKPAIDVPISEATEIRLKYSDNAFTLRFCPVDYDFPARLEYYYSLNNGPWISAQGSTRQSFSSLAPGRYNVRLKTVDSGLESDPVGITFNIRPAWWASAFARIAFALLALGAIAAAWMLIRRTRSAHRRMQQIAEEEKIKESKMEIFTKMAHELRSPLSLIINPLHRLMGNDTDPAHQKSYRTMERNSQRILMLVNQLLEMQKIEGDKLELSFSKVDLIPYIGRIVDNFKDEFALREI
ncbi:MAG: hypothetical protein II095_07060, partial [Bacteroidales bacterium]|nr:hypothetical protein [Bacteroidales bacterium]